MLRLNYKICCKIKAFNTSKNMQRKSALLVSQKMIQYARQSILGIDTV